MGGTPEDALSRLTNWLNDRDLKYRQLAKCKENPETPPSEIDSLEHECRNYDMDLKRLLHKMNGTALCLSGGGIRSASFGLGVLEGLARFSMGTLPRTQSLTSNNGIKDEPHGFLHELDYLSTVSGGGYIGSWLMTWVYRRWMAATREIQAEVAVEKAERDDIQNRMDAAGRGRGTVRSLIPQLTSWFRRAQPSESRQSLEHEELKGESAKRKAVLEQSIKQLCEAKEAKWKTSYDDVVKGLAGAGDFTSGDPAPRPVRHLREYTAYLAPALGLSLDSWQLVAIVFRNLLVNWMMLIPFLFAAVALPQISFHLTQIAPQFLITETLSILALGFVLVLFLRAAIFVGRKLPTHRSVPNSGPGPLSVALSFVGPVLLGNWIVVQVWKSHASVGVGLELSIIFLISWIGFGTLAELLFRSYRGRMLQSNSCALVQGGRGALRHLGMQSAALVSAMITTALLGLLAKWFFEYLNTSHPQVLGFTPDDRLFTILALPLLTLVPLVSASCFSGFVGRFEQEEDREWLSRAGGMQLTFLAVWIVGHGIVLYATEIIPAVCGIGGAILGGIGSALGWSAATSAAPRPVKTEQLKTLGTFLQKHNLLVPTLCAVSLLLITVGIAGAESVMAGSSISSPTPLSRHFMIFATFLTSALILNWAIKLNLFSLHGMYRMRLMRAFLGPSNTQHYPDNFTHFDPNDTPLEIKLPAAAGTPLHLINTSLNLVGTSNLAWKQRKAESFTFTPLHSGGWRLAYVPTVDYAGADGVSLATAMAISGAAFNPNMGYHSSPLVTLLMTFFNARLGWWLPNPKRESGNYWPWVTKGSYFLRQANPTSSLQPLILEALGMTDDRYRWIELTDGAHFENLGLYEMVLRRCHNIVVVDASADPKCHFEDLGNALRKIEIDLGIRICFVENEDIKMEEGAKPSNRYCAVAKIHYSSVDSDADPGDGTLIYIKAVITGKEPPDITEYALTHATFPHESTGNQFFNESQFESYRHLGFHEIEVIAKEGLREPIKNQRSVDIAPAGDFKHFKLAAECYLNSQVGSQFRPPVVRS